MMQAIQPEQRRAAKVVGALYLGLMITGMFAEFFARGPLIVPDGLETARNIAASERLFRMGVVSNLITFAGDVALLTALYVVLSPVNRNLALLGAMWRVAESAILAVAVLNDLIALRLLGGAAHLKTFQPEQTQALARVFVGAQGDGYLVGLFFLGLGSVVFSYVWLKSRYIPGALAILGIFASALLAVVPLLILVLPPLARTVTPWYFVPMFFYEVGIGLWLLVKGIQLPKDAA